MGKMQLYMNKSRIFMAVLFGIALTLGSCKESEYQKIVKSELASGIRHDSLVIGINFGDTKKEFFARCWELNKKGLIGHGPKNMNVQYRMKMDEGSDIMLLFYPVADQNDIIKKMELEYFFEGWSPYNEQYQPDKLIPIVKDSLEAGYPGNPFLESVVDGETYYTKVDGNRRITMKSNNKNAVLVRMVDMTHPDNQ